MPKDHPHAPHDDIVYPAAIPFVLVHVACFGAIWTGAPKQALWVALALYFVRMWAITAGYHRYFSHRSYKTSRLFQFCLALLGQSSAQRGVIWWAAVHRHHHLHSDNPEDVHSPPHHGFWYSHVLWIFNPKYGKRDYSAVRDLTRFRELVILDRNPYAPAALLAFPLLLWGGWSMMVVGFCWSTVLLFHCTFFINSLVHEHGSQRYLTGDDSRNNFLLALITRGEGWHNNHRHYQSSTRQGFRWWEIDVSFYVLSAMSWFRLVWDLREPTEAIVRGERPVGRKVLEKVAAELAGTFSVEAICAHLPTVPELREKAEQMFEAGSSLDAIVARAHEILAQAVAAHLGDKAAVRA